MTSRRAKTENLNSRANFPADTLDCLWCAGFGMTEAENQFFLYPRSTKKDRVGA